MPQSLSHVLLHIVYSTENRRPCLTPEIRKELFPYLATVITSSGSRTIKIGGHIDHVHLLIGLGRTSSVSELVLQCKRSSTRWLRDAWPFLNDFRWQAGYAAYSLSSSHQDGLIRYISNQEEHHRTRSFQDELRELLEENAVEFDEKYIWS